MKGVFLEKNDNFIRALFEFRVLEKSSWNRSQSFLVWLLWSIENVNSRMSFVKTVRLICLLVPPYRACVRQLLNRIFEGCAGDHCGGVCDDVLLSESERGRPIVGCANRSRVWRRCKKGLGFEFPFSRTPAAAAIPPSKTDAFIMIAVFLLGWLSWWELGSSVRWLLFVDCLLLIVCCYCCYGGGGVVCCWSLGLSWFFEFADW